MGLGNEGDRYALKKRFPIFQCLKIAEHAEFAIPIRRRVYLCVCILGVEQISIICMYACMQ